MLPTRLSVWIGLLFAASMTAPTLAQEIKFYNGTQQKNVAAPADTTGYGHGIAVADYNNDGRPDIFVTLYENLNALFIQNASGDFSDQAQNWKIQGDKSWFDRGVACADFDNDGFVDIFLNVAWTQSHLFRNTGKGTFTDVTKRTRVGDTGHAQGVLWADFDNNGRLDVVVLNYETPVTLYMQQPDTTFVDATSSARLGNILYAVGGVAFDANSDGLVDIFIARAEGYDNLLFVNRGNGTFVEEGQKRGVADAQSHGQGAAIGDYDNDGDQDLYVANSKGRNSLFRNIGGGYFEEIADLAGVSDNSRSVGCNFADFDQDGFLDLYVVNFGANKLYRNRGDGTFKLESNTGAESENNGYGSCVTDFDGDGDLDIFMSNSGQKSQYFNNISAAKNWLEITLVGTRSNRNGVGAELDFYFKGYHQHRAMVAGEAFVSGSILPIHTGLGDATFADSVLVRWPSGERTVLREPLANQRIAVVEDQPPVYHRLIKYFVNRLDSVGIQLPDLGSHAPAIGDYDNDGWPDIYIVSQEDVKLPDSAYAGNWLFRNDGTGHFVRTDSAAGVQLQASSAHSGIFADLDRDGDQDLVIGNGEDNLPTRELFINQGDGTFLPEDAALLQTTGEVNTRGLFAGDLNGDGYTDLFFSSNSHFGGEYYLGDGKGQFARNFGLRDTLREMQGVTFVDIDQDGDLDAFIGDFENNHGVGYFQNLGDGAFVPVHDFGLPETGRADGINFGDFDNDGDLDILLCIGGDNPHILFRNDNLHFVEIERFATDEGVPGGPGATNGVFADFDNDGDLDLFLPAAKTRYYRNDGSAGFIPIQNQISGLSHRNQDTRFPVILDYDKDGRIDVLLTQHDGPAYLYYNQLATFGNWLRIYPDGPRGAKGGVGTKAWIYKAGGLGDPSQLLGFQELIQQNGYCIQHEGAFFFGLGEQTAVDLRLAFPGNIWQDYPNTRANQELHLAPSGLGVVITQPVAYATLTVSPITVAGFVWDDNLGYANVNGSKTPVQNGRFETTFGTRSGALKIEVTAKDATGHLGYDSLLVFVDIDTIPPQIFAIGSTAFDDSAQIAWKTSESCVSSLEFGDTTNYSLKLMSFDVDTLHHATVNNLIAGKIYNYRITATDQSGNTTQTINHRFALQPVLVDTTLQAEDLSYHSTGLADGAGGWVMYGNGFIADNMTFPDSANYTFTLRAKGTLVTGIGPELRIDLDSTALATFLVNSTDYASYVFSAPIPRGEHRLVINYTNDFYQNAEDRNVTIDFIRIMGKDTGDKLAPYIGNIGMRYLSDTSVAITWETDEPSIGWVRFWQKNSPDTSASLSVGFKTAHAITLTNLMSTAQYFFTITASDSAGNQDTAAVRRFTLVDKVAPHIEAIRIDNIQTNSAQVHWQTDEPAFGWLEIIVEETEIRFAKDSSAVFDHNQELRNLDAGTAYHLVIMSADTAGNTARRDTVFVTATPSLALHLEAEQFSTKTTGTYQAPAWVLYKEGYISDQIVFPQNASYVFKVNARGNKVSNQWPTMELRLDGSVVDTFSVNQIYYRQFATRAFIASGKHEVSLAFANPSIGPVKTRTLWIDWLEIISIEGLVPRLVNTVDMTTIPTDFFVSTSYPNPFNIETRIDYGLPDNGRVTITIFDVNGHIVLDHEESSRQAGFYRFIWNGRNNSAHIVSSGIYFLRLRFDSGQRPSRIATRRLLLIK